jgi:hypothetical protein
MTEEIFKTPPKEQDIQRQSIWEDILSLPPEAAASKAGARLEYKADKPIYILPLFGETYRVDTARMTVIPPWGDEYEDKDKDKDKEDKDKDKGKEDKDNDKEKAKNNDKANSKNNDKGNNNSDIDFRINFQEIVALSSYLISSFKGPAPGLSNIEISPFSLPSGSFFFKGPHALPGPPIADRYGDDPLSFKKMALSWGAIPKDSSPYGFKIRALPLVEIHFYLDPRDEEFEAEVRYNFDSNIIYHLALDGIFALTNELARRLLGERKAFNPAPGS